MEKFNEKLDLVFARYSALMNSKAEEILNQLRSNEYEVISSVLFKILGRQPDESDFKMVERRYYTQDNELYELWFCQNLLGTIEIIPPTLFSDGRFNPDNFFIVRFTPLSQIASKNK